MNPMPFRFRADTCIAAVLCLLGGDTAVAQRSSYTLFNPVPDSAQRPYMPDRPNQTEGPFTVDAGHASLELSLTEYVYDRRTPGGNDTTTRSLAFAPFSLRIGLLQDLEVQLVSDGYARVRDTPPKPDPVTRRYGFGDFSLRAKYNVWGNDGGGTALGVIPFVHFPSGANAVGTDAVEGGVIFPFAVSLPAGWVLGAQTEVDRQRNDSHDGYETTWVNSITAAHDLAPHLGSFVELSSATGVGPFALSFNAGVSYTLSDDVVLDLSGGVGLTRAADDAYLIAGFSRRF